MGKTIEQAGAKVLLSPIEITKGDDSIWFVPELCQLDIQMNYMAVTEDMFERTEDYQSVISYGQSLQNWYELLNDNGQVKGLNQIVDMQQYISAGLGASASIPFLSFRLFNTPEINMITLRCEN